MTYDTYDKTARTLADRYRSDGSTSRAVQVAGRDAAAATAREAAGTLSGRVREQPLVAVMVAAAIGYIVGRIGRHI